MLATPLSSTREELTERIAYDASNRPEYIGYAAPGTAANERGWQIQKITYGVAGPTLAAFAGSDNGFVHVWDDRAAYVYA
jgi:hypothetical protein